MKSSKPHQYNLVFEDSARTPDPLEGSSMLEFVDNGGSPALLKVFGVGGGGSNAVNRMIQAGLKDVEFWVSNTDMQALERSACHNRLPIGKATTRGLGAGGDPEIGKLSAEEDAESIERIIEGSDMIFITAGMGGGTGTGAAPVIARIARELGVLTVGIVTKPFNFEGKKKLGRARRGLEQLAEHVDTLISIPNDKLMQIVPPGTSFDEALLMADEVLFQATRGISDLIMGHGIINLDFADVRTVMRGRGNALLGSGAASGENRALEAAQKAVSSPLLEDLEIGGAAAVLINIQGGPGMGFHEAAQAAQFVSDQVGEESDVFWGAVVDETMDEDIRVTLVATGFPQLQAEGAADAVAVRQQPAGAPSEPPVTAAGPVETPAEPYVTSDPAAAGAAHPQNGQAAPYREATPEPAVRATNGHSRGAPARPTHEGSPVQRREAVDPNYPSPADGRRTREPVPANAGARTPHPGGEVRQQPRPAAHPATAQGGAGAPVSGRPASSRPAGTRSQETHEVVGEARLITPPEANTRNRVQEPEGRYESSPGRQPGGRLPERERVSGGRDLDPSEANATGLPTSDPGLSRSRWARPEGEDLADEAGNRRLDVPTFLRKRIVD